MSSLQADELSWICSCIENKLDRLNVMLANKKWCEKIKEENHCKEEQHFYHPFETRLKDCKKYVFHHTVAYPDFLKLQEKLKNKELVFNNVEYSTIDREIFGIRLPQSVTTLGEYCFIGCYTIQTISFPSSLRRLKKNCFEGCTSLKSVVFNSVMYDFGGNAFPKSVTSITCDWKRIDICV
ncbi:hypothetical protein QTN25_010506 [Entamoeba marina]